MADDDKLARANGTASTEPREAGRYRIIERPDGVYWEDRATGESVGPFDCVATALADIDASADSIFEPGETLAEAEREVGIADWLDQETGEPAEDSVPRLEDH